MDKANTKLEKAQKKLDDGKAESEQKLSDAERQITDGETQISQQRKHTRKREVADGRCEEEDPGEAAGIGCGKENISKWVFNNWSREKSSMNRGKAAYDAQYAEAQEQIQTGEQGLAVYRAELDQGWDGYQTLLKNIEALKAQVSGETEQDQELTQKIRI